MIGSVNCDVTGSLWCHQKAVSCLGWDKSISDTWLQSRTPGCTRQTYLNHVNTYVSKTASLYRNCSCYLVLAFLCILRSLFSVSCGHFFSEDYLKRHPPHSWQVRARHKMSHHMVSVGYSELNDESKKMRVLTGQLKGLVYWDWQHIEIDNIIRFVQVLLCFMSDWYD